MLVAEVGSGGHILMFRVRLS